MTKQEMINQMDTVLGVNEQGYKVVSSDMNDRVVYVRANRKKKSRVKEFLSMVKEMDLLGNFKRTEADCTGAWIETDRQVALLNNKYYLVSTQSRDC